jgi:hypothetical protein
MPQKLSYLTDFLPYFITTSLLLEAQGKVIIVCFRPHNQGFLVKRRTREINYHNNDVGFKLVKTEEYSTITTTLKVSS